MIVLLTFVSINIDVPFAVVDVIDKACCVKDMIHGLYLCQNKLQREQGKIENEVVGLMNAFQNNLMNDDEINVIDSSTFKNECFNLYTYFQCIYEKS